MNTDRSPLRILCGLWLAEFSTLLDDSESLTLWVDGISAVPQMSPREAIARLRARGALRCVIEAVEESGIKSVGLFESSCGDAHAEPIRIFLSEGKMSEGSDIGYVRTLYRSLGLSSAYLSGSSEVVSLEFDTMCVGRKGADKRLVIGTPVHERFEITRIFVDYVNRYLIPALMWRGYDVVLAMCGARTDYEAIKDRLDLDVNFFVTHENILGEKKNKLLALAQELHTDYIIWIDSDDFFHPDTAAEVVECAESNGYWSSVSPFAFFDTVSGALTKYPGYAPTSDLAAYGMGSGRVFSSAAIGALGTSPFPSRNKSMDHGTRGCLDTLKVPKEKRLLEDLKYLPIGAKSSQNLWSFKDYKGAEGFWTDTSLSWLPRKILDRLLALTDNRPSGEG